ncbi:GlsB/YeaQ/YmgE family stress response membrane protein [Aestuariivirga litoralis]|uniref:GlsB/YeaQ/YmgE family stress response membrane protein n=1 Tax=Aestuariivirga litoralis TaxID=2650924 RepID=UPI0018C7B9B3|nr:GlsB/YeaQ/YmgE family stress response membrane protein [Aestuariivirga litoralis]MBG1232054.1 GlsB/YeaQ/YmgE family stress response membrane protein [Aestuariivirga litoralis]
MGPYLWTGLIGLVAALIAKLLLPGRNGPRNLFVVALLGVAGSFVGTFLCQFFGIYASGEFGFIGSVVGSVVLLFIWDLMFKKKQPVPMAKVPPPPSPPPPHEAAFGNQT